MDSPPISFHEARQIVAMRYRSLWPVPHRGTFYVCPDGFENEKFWHVLVGAREAIEGKNLTDFLDFDTPALLVSKATGAVMEILVHVRPDLLERLEHMDPVHDDEPV